MQEIKSMAEFCQFVKENIKNYLPERYEDVQIHDVRKTNQPLKTAIIIRERGISSAPVIYLEEWFLAYQKGMSQKQILSEIAKERIALPSILDETLQVSDKTKDRIILEAIGAKVMENEELLKSVPHRLFGDIAAVYRIDLGAIQGERRSVLIDYDLAGQFGLTTKELHDLAVKNSIRMNAPAFENLNDILNAMGGYEVEGKSPIYGLTNGSEWGGASVVFYPGIFEKIAGVIGRDFYIIPSSIHEVIIADKNAMEADSLEAINKMIYEINRSQVDPSEWLSDRTHEYDFEKKRVFVCGTAEKDREREIEMEKDADRMEEEKRRKREEDEKTQVEYTPKRLR